MPDRRNPFDGVTDFFSELSRMRSHGLFGAGDGSADSSERTHASAWVPTTDILALGDDLVVRVELAGVDPEDVDVRFSHGVLTISGTRTTGDQDGAAEFLIRERYYGEFRRVITLPDDIDPDQISAEFEDGLVEVTVTRGAARSDATRIDVSDRSRATTKRKVRRSGS